ncbi:hypothetical protein [Larkinella humicola]|uniref:PEGA domain-containing protein n=1 Tax=Larkinella humicola TaxID=2607654 RepID=A0A5N1JIX7_9BACT|nr:hypothetical protein [Larkinella humicola]KAA9356400.1 hypothetical protein F0P93_01200 [Larkinella humicola]
MRVLLVPVALFMTHYALAQDNLVLRSGEEIPAKVLEINQTDLKYRKSANLDGPVYTAPLRDVLFIKYANGTKDTFEAGRAVAPTLPAPRESGESVAPALNTTGLAGLRYHRSLFSRYFTDANDEPIPKSEVRLLLQAQPTALKYYQRGRSLRVWSVATAIPAALLIGTGVGLMVVGDGEQGHNRMLSDRPYRNRDFDNPVRPESEDGSGIENFGAILAGSGVLLGAAAVWFDHRASVQFRRADNRFNHRHSTSVRFVPARRSLGVRAVLTF